MNAKSRNIDKYRADILKAIEKEDARKANMTIPRLDTADWPDALETYQRTEPTPLRLAPCFYVVPATAACELIGRTFPDDCQECSDYFIGLTDAARQRCEVWTRVMGYHRPVSCFNGGKRAEHAERKLFTEAKASHP